MRWIVIGGVLLWIFWPWPFGRRARVARRVARIVVRGDLCSMPSTPARARRALLSSGIGESTCTNWDVILRGGDFVPGDTVEVDGRLGTQEAVETLMSELEAAGFVVEEVTD